ncbi:hypothetical protein J3R83DRAFT_3108 [Lanmaoa asiatica]|nr:hypothetical protein J3R83DRAFT_3108 [Lanmaoa asiatica]
MKKPCLVKFDSPTVGEDIEYQWHHVYEAQNHGEVTVQTAFLVTQTLDSKGAEPTTTLNASYDTVQGNSQMDADADAMENTEGTHLDPPVKKQMASEWNGDYFQRVPLKSLGLRIQLGHPLRSTCYNQKPAGGDDFVVINTNGVHGVTLDFCGCEQAQTHYKQLLRSRWFPVTTTEPRTAVTFAVLKAFHLLSLESKVSAYEYYNSIARLTDNTGVVESWDHYPTFLRMAHEFRHLKQLKQAGRGHDPKGVDATKEGECAIKCPACPHPGINLPLGWERKNPEQGWIYALFIAIDANFHLKWKAVLSDDSDPSLNCGWAYFIEDQSYKAYLVDRVNIAQEKSTCVGYNAINMADSKSSRGLAVTGVGTVDCARHDMKLPNGMGDLQKGERYVNMDYLVFSAMAHFALAMYNFSYDIACQWHKKLWSHVSTMPEQIRMNPKSKIIWFFVPKFHLKAHVQSCQTMFSFNFSRWVGQTDSEAPERGWAIFNRVASSMKEMGPGVRCDALDDFYGDSNWKKCVGFVRESYVTQAD